MLCISIQYNILLTGKKCPKIKQENNQWNKSSKQQNYGFYKKKKKKIEIIQFGW